MTESGNKRSEIGRRTEELAERHLAEQGLKPVRRNYCCRGGEIDLIMEDGDTLVFVEVRYRKHNTFGGALESVDYRKQQRLMLAAQHYLQRHSGTDRPCRFDVVAASPGRHGHPAIQWIRNAIEQGG